MKIVYAVRRDREEPTYHYDTTDLTGSRALESALATLAAVARTVLPHHPGATLSVSREDKPDGWTPPARC